jgi:hypothetical protein
VKPFVSVPLSPTRSVTVTLRAPTVAPPAAIVMLAVSWVAEVNAVLFTVIPAPKLAVAPLTNPAPVIVTLLSVAPCAP